jgi:hypothetical protein
VGGEGWVDNKKQNQEENCGTPIKMVKNEE